MSCPELPVPYIDTITLPNNGIKYEGCLLSSSHPANVACSTDPAASPRERCPEACSTAAGLPTEAQRVRRALHTLSDEEWQRVVDAFWVMRTTETTEGQALYGPSYRGWDYWTILHIAAGSPPYDPDRSCMPAGAPADDAPFLGRRLTTSDGCPGGTKFHCYMPNTTTWQEAKFTSKYGTTTFGEDVTGGGQQQLIWHSLITFQFETALLAVDPSIGGLPYLDWAASAADGALDLFSKAGEPSCQTTNGDDAAKINAASDWCVVDQGPFANWPTLQSWDLAGYFESNPGSASDAAVFSATFNATLPVDADCDTGLGKTDRACPGSTLMRNDPSNEPSNFRADGFSDNVSAAFEYCVKSGAVMGGDAASSAEAASSSWRFPELAACYESRLADQAQIDMSGSSTAAKVDGLHRLMHLWLSGNMKGIWAFEDPFGWFHHTGGDRLFREWQQRNPQLRHQAYGYPLSPAYNLTRMPLSISISRLADQISRLATALTRIICCSRVSRPTLGQRSGFTTARAAPLTVSASLLASTTARRAVASWTSSAISPRLMCCVVRCPTCTLTTRSWRAIAPASSRRSVHRGGPS